MALDDELEFKVIACKEEIPEFCSLATCDQAEKQRERVTIAYSAFAQVEQDSFSGVRLKNGLLCPSDPRETGLQCIIDNKLELKVKTKTRYSQSNTLTENSSIANSSANQIQVI
eukprot:c25370_g1_i1 orf=487-828(+)